jgi:hypothetical protein
MSTGTRTPPPHRAPTHRAAVDRASRTPRRAHARRRPPAPSPGRRVRRVAVVASLLVLLPVFVAFSSAMAARSDSSFSIRAVEWLRSNGARGLVNQIETMYYSLNAPATGGPGLKRLPDQPGASLTQTRARRHHVHYTPPPIAPILHPALPGEGVWRSTFVGHHGPPPVLVTSFRSDPNYPQMVAGVAWIDHTQTSVMLYPGVQEPAVPMSNRGPEEVPMALRNRLVATFNSAFKLSDSSGGFGYDGHTYAPMVQGIATIVRFRNGRVNVVRWESGPDIGPNVVYARQNLPLIVDGGHPNPNLSDGPEWGATLGNAIRVWRSAIGIDRHGNLLYAAANDQTVGSLAAIMVHAGAVRAMELDINAYWPSFITYHRPGAIGAANFLPDMVRSPQRYLTPDDRDFFAVFTK